MPLTTHLVVGQKAERVLLFMHGFGADEKDLAGLLPHLDPEGRFVAVLPRAQYSGPVGYAWYQLGSSAAVAASQLRTSLESVEEVFTKACDDHGMLREDAIVGGFSQGGSMAIALAYGEGRVPRPSGVLVMSGFMAPDETYAYHWDDGPPPALVQHGTEDPMVPVQVAQATAWTMQSAGAPVTYRTYPMEHQVAMESITDARAWIDAIRRGERPNEQVEPPAEMTTDQSTEAAAEEPARDEGALVRDVTAATFDREVLQSEVPVIVDFWAPWCAPCRAVSPLVEQIAAMRKGSYKVVKLNIDEAPAIAQQYKVQSIPMIGLFRNGRLERQSMGAKPRPQIEAELGLLVIP